MARREGEREGLALLRALRDRNIGTPVVIYAANYARSRKNRMVAKTAGAHAVTNDSDDLGYIVHNFLQDVAPLNVAISSSRLIESTIDNYALVLTSDDEGGRIHAVAARRSRFLLRIAYMFVPKIWCANRSTSFRA